jgi:hypothetical protein
LAKTFEKNSSSNNYSNEFQQHKCKAEKESVNFTSRKDEDYNSLFSIDDLIYSIKTAKDSAAGPDEINYHPNLLTCFLTFLTKFGYLVNFLTLGKMRWLFLSLNMEKIKIDKYRIPKESPTRQN